MWTYQVLLQDRVDLGVMAMKEDSKLSRSTEPKPHYQMYFVSSYLPAPPLGQDMTQGQFLSGV